MPDFINVLPLLEQAVSELRDNELIQSDNIGLFETTSAIEIGEPRMDTGVYTEEEKSFPHLDVFQPLMPSEIVWVMDQMLALEMKWFQGYALAQTVFTCKYIHELDKLDLEDVFMRKSPDPTYPVQLMTVVLRSFLRGTLKTCDIAMEEMSKRHIYDNEDYVSDNGGISLLETVEIDTILEELNDAVQFLMNWTGDLASQWRVPLLTRLRIRTEMLCSVCLLVFDPPLYDQVGPHTEALRQALSYLDKQPPSSSSIPGAINPYLGKHLDTLAPPRPSLPVFTPEEGFKYLEGLLDDIDGAVALINAQDWVSIEDHFLRLSKRKDLSPYIRSLHQSIFYHDRIFCGCRDLSWIGRQFINDYAGCTTAIWDFIEGYNDLESPSMSTLHRFVGLIGQIAWRLLDYISYLGKNRARQYRKLPRLLDSLATLEKQAADLAPPFNMLLDQYEIEHTTLDLPQAFRSLQAFVRAEVVLIGFDLELYALNELPAVYWYLAKVTNPAQSADYVANNPVVRQRILVSNVHHHLASATCIALVLAGVLPQNTSLGRTIFDRRFKWALAEDNSLQPDWHSFVAHFERLAGESHADLVDSMRDQCTEAGALLGTLDDKVAASLRETCQSYLTKLHSTQDFGELSKTPLLPFPS